MLVNDDGHRRRSTSAAIDDVFRLEEAVGDLYAHRQLTPLLRRLLEHSGRLLGIQAGSISVIDTNHGRYSKIAERGVPCRLGQSFPLDEGATGRAVTRRCPVVLDDYRAVRTGHLPPGHPAGRGAVAAVPIWWRDDVIGVVRVFGDLRIDPQSREVEVAGRQIALTRREFDLLGALSERPRVVLSRRQLIDRVWGGEWIGDDRLVDIHLGHVRRKLGDDPAAPRYVLTVRGVGYRMGPGRV
jgi:hypothetical protein